MNTNVAQNEELSRLEILRVFKNRFAGERVNFSPFADDRVIRIDTPIAGLDVPDIHRDARLGIQGIIKEIQDGRPSKIVILAGEAGMGKSHLLNYFRVPELGQQLGYVLVGNSNHWKVQEFEACLLDWILDALLRPSPTQPHLLLEKMEAIGFEALRQILDRPGQLRHFIGRKDAGFWRRQWAKLFGSGPARFHRALNDRQAEIFRRLHFDAFADFVIERFLPVHASKPFHRYVLKCLLLYLFPEEREKVIHWLRRQPVEQHFVRRLGIGESIDTQFKVINAIQILISMFTPDVSRLIHPQAPQNQGLVFFFAFDQMEGRQELFDEEKDWFKFFGKLSELYNTLPNIFFMFTMTLHLRNKLYPAMERQFQNRIIRDSRYVLQEVQPEEILAIYRQRIARWLGDANAETLERLQDQRFRYLPFQAEEIQVFSQGKTLREVLETMDERFREHLDTKVVVDDPRFEYLVSMNELREKARGMDQPFKFTESHLTTVTDLMNRSGGALVSSFGLCYKGMAADATVDGLPALRLDFCHPEFPEKWIRVFLVRLRHNYANHIKGCVGLLANLRKEQYFLWLIRPERIDKTIEDQRPGQVYARVLHSEWECSLKAMLRLLDKSEGFGKKQRYEIETVMHQELQQTYLGEILEDVAVRLGVTSPANGASITEVAAEAEEVIKS